ncbi:pyruvate formate lyase family protein, partial [Enterobacter hormaechei]|uniref:pyruvate formate lyase family protein n=1 Tax=Enterobacter hormaechei TaxID=158836 RepID=UPI003C75700F
MLVVNQGFLAIKAQLEDRMRSIGSAVNRSSMDEANFCKSAIYACEAALYFAQLLSAIAENLAAMEGNPYRKAELLES